MLMCRSSRRKVAASFPGRTCRKIPRELLTQFCLFYVRLKPATNEVVGLIKVSYSCEYSLKMVGLVSLTLLNSAEYCSHTCHTSVDSPSVSVKFAAMSSFFIEPTSLRSRNSASVKPFKIEPAISMTH
jgi:hypothetical protein